MKAKSKSTDLDKYFDSTPEIINLEAQLSEFPLTLLLTLESDNCDVNATILFKHILGFRVLDEGHLLDFWVDARKSPNTYVWEIISGGWLDLENKNNGDLLTITTPWPLTEFLILGVGMCVNVLVRDIEAPIVTKI